MDGLKHGREWMFLAGLLCLTAWAGDAAAEFPGGSYYGPAKFPGNALIPGSPYAPPGGGYVPPPPVVVPAPKNPWWNSCGKNCYSHHDMPRCGNCQSTLIFIFGSCRAFFGEPCLQGPPPLPEPNGLGYRPTRPPLPPGPPPGPGVPPLGGPHP